MQAEIALPRQLCFAPSAQCTNMKTHLLASHWSRALALPVALGLAAFATRQAPAQSTGGELRAIEPSEATGSAQAVVVGRAALAHTSLLQPVDERGKLVGYEHPTIQTERLMDNLETVLAEAQTSLDRVVKLNVYVKDADVVRDVQRVFSRKFAGGHKPAVTYVESELSLPGSYIALDAVAATSFGLGQSRVERFSSHKLQGHANGSHVAIMPDGVRIHVSGQAERGPLREATAATMQSLFKTLEFLSLTPADVVQVKAFFKPMSSAREVEAEIVRAFTGLRAPPVTFTEWTMNDPVEIELVAYGGNQGDRAREAIEYLTPPGVVASPVYSRVARINFGKTIFTSGLHGGAGGADIQIQDAFQSLEQLLILTGSDLKHLAKATYYVTDAQTSTRLNELRPRFYDAKRPPAASKATVRGVAQSGRSLVMDFIAVTKP